jgi:hypothetical protein
VNHESVDPSKATPVTSYLSRLFFDSATDELHKDGITDLMGELSRVRRRVHREYQWFTQKISKHEDHIQRKRMLYLFVKDLSQGVSGEVLAKKEERDSMSTTLQHVPFHWQFLGWVFVFVLNFGMLFYVYLFALNQTNSRQTAWFKSLLMWFLFDILIASTGAVIVTHLLIPLYVLTDVAKLKEQLLSDLKAFRAKGGSTSTPDKDSFNSAKYLYSSWRVASLFPALPESGLILQFSTIWPSKRFGEAEVEIEGEYEEAVIWNAVSQITLYFLASFLNCNFLIQDVLVQTVCNTGFGYLIISFIQLARISPWLPVLGTFLFLLCLYLLLRFFSGKNDELIHKLDNSAIHPLPPDIKQDSPSLEPLPPPAAPPAIVIQDPLAFNDEESLSSDPDGMWEISPGEFDSDEFPFGVLPSLSNLSNLNFSLSGNEDSSSLDDGPSLDRPQKALRRRRLSSSDE